MANLLQNLANGVRAAFPATPAPTNATLSASQTMPGTGSANANAQNTVNTLFGSKTPTPTQQTIGNQASAMPQITPQPVNINMSGMKGLTFAGNQAPTGFNPITTGGDISKAPATYSGGSIVDYLNSSGQKSDYATRAGLAQKYGITGYGGTAEQNTQLLNAMRNGTQSPQMSQTPQPTPTPTPTYQQAPQGNSTPSGTPTGGGTPPAQTSPASTPDGKTTPQGNAGYTDNRQNQASGQDLSYGGLIQESLKKQQDTANRITGMQNELSNTLGQVENRSIPLEFKTGRQQVLQTLAGQRIANEQANLANQANIYGKAISATAPVQGATFFRDPVTGNLITGNGSIADAAGLTGQMAIGARLPEMKIAVNNANNVKSVLQNLVATTNINPSDFKDINKLAAFWGGKTGDPQYAQLSNLANQFATSIAAIMGVSPDTVITNAQAKGEDILQTMNDLYNQAMQTYNTAQDVANNGAGGTSSSNDPLGIL